MVTSCAPSKDQIAPDARATCARFPESRRGSSVRTRQVEHPRSRRAPRDAERIFAYRALRFARGDATPLPGFDENAFVANARLDDRSLASLIDEYEAVRDATIAMFDAFFPEEWLRAR